MLPLECWIEWFAGSLLLTSTVDRVATLSGTGCFLTLFAFLAGDGKPGCRSALFLWTLD